VKKGRERLRRGRGGAEGGSARKRRGQRETGALSLERKKRERGRRRRLRA
jgi:hypothetical protein